MCFETYGLFEMSDRKLVRERITSPDPAFLVISWSLNHCSLATCSTTTLSVVSQSVALSLFSPMLALLGTTWEMRIKFNSWLAGKTHQTVVVIPALVTKPYGNTDIRLWLMDVLDDVDGLRTVAVDVNRPGEHLRQGLDLQVVPVLVVPPLSWVALVRRFSLWSALKGR